MPLRYPAFPRTFERAMEAHFAGFLLSHQNVASPLGPYAIFEGHEAYGRWLAHAVIDPETGRPAAPAGVPKLPTQFVFCYGYGFDPPPGDPSRAACQLRVGCVTNAYLGNGLAAHDAAASAIRGLISDAEAACTALLAFIDGPPGPDSPGHPHRYAAADGLSRSTPSENEFGGAGSFGASWVWSETWTVGGYLREV